MAELGIATPRTTLERLAELAQLLERWGARINLTGHRSAEGIVRRLVLDAVALSGCLPICSSLNDLGSGAGFPGLPIAILRPAAAVLLVESRERRQHFQRAAIRELHLSGVTTLRGRIEDAEPQQAETVIAQAVARPERVVEWMLPWATSDGLLVIPGGVTSPEIAPHPQISHVEVRDYRVPLGGPQRTLWLGRVERSR